MMMIKEDDDDQCEYAQSLSKFYFSHKMDQQLLVEIVHLAKFFHGHS